MRSMVDTFCWYIELRIGCIAIGISAVILGLITPLSVTNIYGFIAIPFSFLCSAGLIFATVYAQGTSQNMTIGVNIYLVTCILCVVLSFIIITLLFVTWWWYGTGSQEPTTMYVTKGVITSIGLAWIGIDIYFALVAFGFYQSLKEGKEEPLIANEVVPT